MLIYKKLTNNDLNNPIASLHYSLSPPCINTNIEFMNRTRPIPIIYRNQNNNCDKYYTTFHSQYLRTGLELTELSVYQDNGFLDELQERVPKFNASFLEMNKYRLYYKPYALWTIKCQKKLPTIVFQSMAEIIMQKTENQGTILKLSSYFIALEYVEVFLMVILNRHIKDSQRKYFNIGVLMCFAVTMSILTAILVNYLNLFGNLHYEGLEVISFANRELCSDGVLGQALQYYEKSSQYDQSMIRFGYISTAVIMFLNFFAMLFLSDLPKMVYRKFINSKYSKSSCFQKYNIKSRYGMSVRFQEPSALD